MLKKLISLGVDGGGFTVYETANNEIVEIGSSGGILDNEEDPIRKWEKKFDTLEDWWLHFTTTHRHFWICFNLSFIDDSIKEFVLQKVKEFDGSQFEDDYHKNNWLNYIEYHK